MICIAALGLGQCRPQTRQGIKAAIYVPCYICPEEDHLLIQRTHGSVQIFEPKLQNRAVNVSLVLAMNSYLLE